MTTLFLRTLTALTPLFVYSSALGAPIANYSIVNTLSHNTDRYTQGLLWHNNLVIESAGGLGVSGLYVHTLPPNDTQPADEKIEHFNFSKQLRRGHHLFAEGATLIDDRLFVLTWKNQVMYQFALNPLRLTNAHRLYGEWWGLSHFNGQLVASNGSDKLAFIDISGEHPRVARYLAVSDGDKQWRDINELEQIGNLTLANIWQTDTIIAIDTATGVVQWQLDLSALTKQEPNANANDNVLNGIAFDQTNQHLIVTGKRWSKQFVLHVPKLIEALGE